MSYGVDRRNGSDLTLLWLWCRLAAVAHMWLLVWELPYAIGVVLKKRKKKDRHKKTYLSFISTKGQPFTEYVLTRILTLDSVRSLSFFPPVLGDLSRPSGGRTWHLWTSFSGSGCSALDVHHISSSLIAHHAIISSTLLCRRWVLALQLERRRGRILGRVLNFTFFAPF